MNRRTRHVVVLVVAVITASLASFGVYRAMVGLPSWQNAQQHQPVVVAARPIAIGSALTAEDVKVLAWPAASPLPGAISTTKDVVSRALLTSVLLNEPITENKLASAQAGAGLAPGIPQGMRAMAVKVNDVIGVAGFIAPGSRVDVVVTIRSGESGASANTVATNVQVLTVGTRQDQGKPEVETKPKDTTVVTVMVTPEDAQRIALAMSEGQIVLSLRNPLDTGSTMPGGVKTGTLLGKPDEPPPPTAPPPVVRASVPRRPPLQQTVKPETAEPPKYIVDSIRGGKRTQEPLGEPGKQESAKEPGKEGVK